MILGWDAHRLSSVEAGRRVREAETLAGRPRVLAALGEGAVAVEQARVVCRVLVAVEAVPDVDPVDREDATELDGFPYAADPKAGFDNTKGLQRP